MSKMQQGDSPSDHTVAEVNEYLVNADDAETQRVLSEERSGDNRVTITGNSEQEQGQTPERMTPGQPTYTEATSGLGQPDPNQQPVDQGLHTDTGQQTDTAGR